MKVEINDEIIHSEIHRMVHQYEDELRYQGASLDQYFKMTGTTMEDLEKMMHPQAEARIKTRYLLEAIVEKEGIKVTDKEVKEEIKTNAEKYGMKEEEFVSAIGGEEAIKYDLRMRKALDIINNCCSINNRKEEINYSKEDKCSYKMAKREFIEQMIKKKFPKRELSKKECKKALVKRFECWLRV